MNVMFFYEFVMCSIIIDLIIFYNVFLVSSRNVYV